MAAAVLRAQVLRRLVGVACLALALSACAGGGGSAAPTPTPPPSAASSSAAGSVASASVAPTPGPSRAPQGSAAPSFGLPGVIGKGDIIDVCSALSQKELQDLVGHDLVGTVDEPQFQIDSGCTWSFKSGYPDVSWELQVGVLRPRGREQFDLFMPVDPSATPLPTFGDVAWWDADDQLMAAKGDTLVQVVYIGAADDDTRKIVSEVMTLVLARLA